MGEPELELDETSHVYRLDGTVIPGCTAVLSAMGCTPGFNWLTPEQLEFYRSRGHATHKAIELAVKGTLDKRTIADEINPYLIGWDRFCNDHKFDVWMTDWWEQPEMRPFVEIPLHHPTFRYGVTPDVVGIVDGADAVIEVKTTSAHSPTNGIQLAAQLLAVRNVLGDIKGFQRIGLRLLSDEPYYDMKFYEERSDEAVWLSLLNSYNWLSRHRLLRKESF